MKANGADITETPFHELGHNFDNYKWTFEPEALAILKIYYYFDQTDDKFALKDNEYYIGGSGYKTYMKSYAERLSGHISYDDSIAQGVYSPYGLAYNLGQIADKVGWDAFKQTFRDMGELEYGYVPKTNIEKFNLFLTTLSYNSGEDIFELFTSQEKAVYEKKLGGTIEPLSPTWTGTLIETSDGYEFNIERNEEYISWPLPPADILRYLIPIFAVFTSDTPEMAEVYEETLIDTEETHFNDQPYGMEFDYEPYEIEPDAESYDMESEMSMDSEAAMRELI